MLTFSVAQLLEPGIKLFDDGWDIHVKVLPVTDWLNVLRMNAVESLVHGISSSLSFVLRDQD